MPAVATPRPVAVRAPDGPADRYRRARRASGTSAWDAVGRLGSVVTLVALLVVAATAGGLADGVPATDNPTVSATFER